MVEWRIVADRLTKIRHEHASSGNRILELEYDYYANDLIESITETDSATEVTEVFLTYDNRGRLINEARFGLVAQGRLGRSRRCGGR